MVFPIGAQIRELAADHLDRLPGKSLIDGLVHKSSVTEDGHARSTNEPQHSRDWRGNQTERNSDDYKARVQLRRRGTDVTENEVAAVEEANEIHADNDEDDVEQKERVGDEGVDAQHSKDSGIVAGVVAQVVVDTRLGLVEVGGLGEPLEVEELADGSQVAEASAHRGGADALEPFAKVEARGDGLNRNLDASHCG
jgi:hypothetical protein